MDPKQNAIEPQDHSAVAPAPILTQQASNFAPANLPSYKHSRKWLGISAIIVAILIGGAYAAYALVLSPGRAIPAAVTMIEKAPKMHIGFGLSVTSDTKQINGASLSVDSKIDRTKAKAVSSQSVISISGDNMRAGGEIRFVDGTFYGEITEMPSSALSGAGKYLSKWYSVSLETLALLASSTGQASIPKATSLADVFNKLDGAGVLKDMTFTGFRFVGSVPVRVYSMKIDKAALAKYISLQYESTNKEKYSSVDVDSAVSKVLENVDFSPISITTDLVSGSLTSFALGITFKYPATSYTPATSATINLNGSYDDKPESFTIAAPEGATSLDSYFLTIIQSMTHAKEAGKNARIISDVSQLRTDLEAAFNGKTFPANCKSSNYSAIKADIESQGSTLVCRVNAGNYSVTARLLATSTASVTQYFCIDSMGLQKYMTKAPSGYSCR